MLYNKTVMKKTGFSPRFYRSFAAWSFWRRVKLAGWVGEIKKSSHKIKIFLLVYLLFSSVLLSGFSIFLARFYQSLKKEREKEIARLVYWQDVIKKHPNFPSAYYNGALHAFLLKDKKQAVELLNKAIFLDPNFEAAEKLLDDISSSD